MWLGCDNWDVGGCLWMGMLGNRASGDLGPLRQKGAEVECDIHSGCLKGMNGCSRDDIAGEGAGGELWGGGRRRIEPRSQPSSSLPLFPTPLFLQPCLTPCPPHLPLLSHPLALRLHFSSLQPASGHNPVLSALSSARDPRDTVSACCHPHMCTHTHTLHTHGGYNTSTQG